MADKRFKVIDNSFSMWIVDTTLKEDRHEGAIYTAYDMCHKLNELYEENEKLKELATRTEEEKEYYADLYDKCRRLKLSDEAIKQAEKKIGEQQATIQPLKEECGARENDLRECRARKRIMAEKLKQYQDIAKRFDCASSQEVENLILSLQDLCGKSDYENAKLRIENKELQDKIDWLCEVFDYGSDESIKSSSPKKGKVVR